MNIWKIAYKNLLRKKTRTILTIIAIALSSGVLVSLLGFNNGYRTSLNRDIDNMGFQMIVTAKGCPYEAATLMLKGGTGLRYIKQDIGTEILKYSGVEKITPMLMQAVFDPNKGETGGISAYLGVDPATFPAMKGYLIFEQGEWFNDPKGYEAVMGYEAAELEQREVGDKLLIPEMNVTLIVKGVLKRTGTQDDGTIFVPIKTLQHIFAKSGEITGVGIKVSKDVNMGELENKLYDLPDVQVVSLAQVKQTIMDLVNTARMMVFTIALIAILISMVGVINTILMSVFERYQEIGIIKSMGAMPKDIFALIWIETVILCLGGGILGIILSLVMSRITEIVLRNILPYTPTGNLIMIDVKLAVLTVFLITGVGILSGLYPAFRASRIKPIEAIRSEEN